MKNYKCVREYKQWVSAIAYVSAIIGISGVVCSENLVKSKIQITRVSEVTDNNNHTLISYHNTDNYNTYELIGSGFNSDVDFFLLKTPSEEYCIVSSQTLPAIKINKNNDDSLLYVKFNKANHFQGCNYYLCYFTDELLSNGLHLGNSSLFVM